VSLPGTSVALLLAALALYTCAQTPIARSRLGERGRNWLIGGLVVLAFVGHASLLQRGDEGFSLRVPPPHLHEFFHYYVGTRYFAELGHTGLYAATVVADHEDHPERFRPGERVRNLTTNVPEPRRSTLAAGWEVKARFSPERWQAFKRDVALIRDANPPDLWDRRGYVMDHGYNGTPLTTWVLGGLARQDWIPPGPFIGLMRWVDPYLLGLAGLIVVGLEGPATGLAFLFFAFANPLNDYAFVGGAYLRYGYLLALVGACVALRRGFGASAGALFAVATGLRLFPVVFYGALGLQALLHRDRWRRLRDQRRLHLGFVATGLAIVAIGASVDTPTGRSAWLDFADNIRLHGRTPAANQIGLLTPFAYSPEKDRHPSLAADARARPGSEHFDWVSETRRVLDDRRAIHTAAVIAALLGVLAWLRRAPDGAIWLPGFALLFTSLPLGHYYWALLCLLPLAHPERRDLHVALAVLCAVWVALAGAGSLDARLDLRFTSMSLALAAFLAFAALRTARTAPAVAALAALVALGCGPPPQPILEGNGWRSRALGASIEKPDDWVFLPSTSLRYDADERILDRGELWERLDRPGIVPLVSLASRPDPVPGRDALLHVYVIPVRPQETPRGTRMQLGVPSHKAVRAFVTAKAGTETGFSTAEETREHEISGIGGATIDARYRSGENGSTYPTLERMAHLKRGEEFWYVRRIGPDPFPAELERQFDQILASLQLVAAVLVLAAIALALYAGGLGGPFVMDDAVAIERNPWIRSLWPPTVPLSPPRETPVAGRPIANASFALSYALGGLDPYGYRLFNLALHVACGGVLFALLRRTFAARGVGAPGGIALAASAIWLAHPLTSECVLYATQRTESLMALCYLLTLEGTSRAVLASRAGVRRRGAALAIVACAIGMASKESMVSAPVAALLYDAVFGAGSPRAALARRRGLYAGLATSWLVLAALQVEGPRTLSTGLDTGVSIGTYLAHQMQMLATYLARSLWPHPLVFDYGWPLPLAGSAVWREAIVVAVWVGGALALLWRRPAAGLPLVVGLMILAPSSSLVPIATEVGAERRMYLPLAGFVALLALVGARGLAAWTGSPTRARRIGALLATLLVCALGAVTRARSHDYADAERLWRSVVQARPDQPRGLLNLGEALRVQGRLGEAESLFAAALRAYPSYARAEAHRALVDLDRGDLPGAEAHLRRALELDPRHGDLRTNLGEVQARQGRIEAALVTWLEALSRDPELAYAANNLAWVLATHPEPRLRDAQDAVRLAERAAALTASNDAAVLDTLAAAYAEAGRFSEASASARRAIALARADGDADLARAIAARLAGYAAGRPHRDPPAAP
jgi:Flp pilus assembly protein TadD